MGSVASSNDNCEKVWFSLPILDPWLSKGIESRDGSHKLLVHYRKFSCEYAFTGFTSRKILHFLHKDNIPEHFFVFRVMITSLKNDTFCYGRNHFLPHKQYLVNKHIIRSSINCLETSNFRAFFRENKNYLLFTRKQSNCKNRAALLERRLSA